MDASPDNPRSPFELSLRTRDQNIERMSREEFDVVIIGGGITGAGVALDCAARGLTVALVEQRDFASGTSSRSSKLIHGGLRYLEQLQFGLVRESLHERATLQKIAPHLSRPLSFVVPIYEPPRVSPLGSNKLKLRIGLSLYDLLAGRRNLGRHFWLEGKEAAAFATGLDSRGLRGCFVYRDALTDDSRLVIEVIKEAAARGAVLANYAPARGLTKGGERIRAVMVEDSLSTREFEVRGKVVVNACGVWGDEVARFAGDAPAELALRPSKGIHIIISAAKVHCSSAVLIPSHGENRFLFVIPWHGRTLIGTTDSDYTGELNEPQATEDEIERLVRSTADYFPGSNLTTGDVVSVFAGLRPLVAGRSSTTKDLSRREYIVRSRSGLISVIGGKLTTYRRIAERVVDLALEDLGRPKVQCSTGQIVLAGGAPTPAEAEMLAREAADSFGVSASVISHLIGNYGGNYETVLKISDERSGLKSNLIDGLLQIGGEVVYAARHEMATSVEDFLYRRSRLALLTGDHGASCADRVAELLEVAAPN